MRYWGQSFELSVPAPDRKDIDTDWMSELIESFHESHNSAYGFRADDEPVELVNLRLTTIGKIARPQLRKLDIINPDIKVAIKGERPVYFANESSQGGVISTTVYNRQKLPPRSTFNGPAIVEEPDCTTVIQPSWSVTVDDFGNLLVENNQ